MEQLISVIIPCYNSAGTIHRTIKSVLQQTNQNFEIVVVDDASSDSAQLKQEIEQFADHRIKYLKHETNKNGSAARNTGILNASGEYIAFLDSDDEWYPDHLANSINQFQKAKNSNYIIYCKNNVKTGKNADLIMPAVGIGSTEKLSDYLFCNAGYMSTPSLFGPATIFKNNLFDEKLIRHQDYELLLRLESCGIDFSFSNHIGVVVHWEDNDPEKKGGTWEYSLEFAKKHMHLFTSKAYSYFILKNVVFPLFNKKEKRKGLNVFRDNCQPSKIKLREWLFFIDYLVFGKLTFIKLYSKIKK